MQTLFISDLHLEDQRPDITRAFFHLLDQFQGKVDRLFILGDFFEIWLGDDVLTDTARQVASRLKSFSDAGAGVYLMHGNRDFLLGEQYSAQCGAELLPEPTTIELSGRPCLLMHGDSLCTDDKPYMEFRAMVRNPLWQQGFLAKSVEDRIAFGRQARTQSQEDAKEKSTEILDVNQQEVVRVCEASRAPLFIHGHTHRPARHLVDTGKNQCERIVLGDWHQQGWYILANDAGLELVSFDFPD